LHSLLACLLCRSHKGLLACCAALCLLAMNKTTNCNEQDNKTVLEPAAVVSIVRDAVDAQ
jgi:hypothetical protein